MLNYFLVKIYPYVCDRWSSVVLPKMTEERLKSLEADLDKKVFFDVVKCTYYIKTPNCKKNTYLIKMTHYLFLSPSKYIASF